LILQTQKPALQISPGKQVPHETLPPQPSGSVLHSLRSQYCLGTHLQVLPTQVSGARQLPQLSVPPQPSAMSPH
jgi:hypothetical protein